VIDSLRRPCAAASVALGFVFQVFPGGDDCRAEGPRPLPEVVNNGVSRAIEPATPLFIESDANTPARLAPVEGPSAPPATRLPLMCCRPTHTAAPRNIHPTLAALAEAVKPRHHTAAGRPAMSHDPDSEGPAAIEPPAGTNLVAPKLISNPWARAGAEQPAEPSRWRTSENRAVRLARFNELPPAAPAAISPRPSGEGLMIADRAIEHHAITDRSIENMPAEVPATGANPLRAAANHAVQRPDRWSGLNPLR